MAKFFIKENNISGNKILITDEDAKHIKNVLRHRIGDEIVCSGESGLQYITEIVDFNDNLVELNILATEKDESEPNINITLYQGLPKADKMELIIQKAVELGVKNIIPLMTKRVIVKVDEKTLMKKLTRWQRIAEAAAKQSMRGMVPKIANLAALDKLANELTNYDLVIVPYEGETVHNLKQLLQKVSKDIKNIAIIIGPEGGFAKTEIDYLEKADAKIVTLGKRILRTETAGLATVAMLIYEFDF